MATVFCIGLSFSTRCSSLSLSATAARDQSDECHAIGSTGAQCKSQCISAALLVSAGCTAEICQSVLYVGFSSIVCRVS